MDKYNNVFYMDFFFIFFFKFRNISIKDQYTKKILNYYKPNIFHNDVIISFVSTYY